MASYGLVCLLLLSFVLWVIRLVRLFKKGKNYIAATTGESSFGAFSTLLKTGNTNDLADDAVIDPRFKAHYDQYIRPRVDAFEARRVEALRTMRQRMRMVIPLAFLVFVLALMFAKPAQTNQWNTTIAGHSIHGTSTTSGNPIGMIGGALVFLLAINAFAPTFFYKNSIKQQLFPEVFRFFGSEWRYEPHGLSGASSVLDLQDFEGKTALQGFQHLRQAASQASTNVGAASNGSRNSIMAPYMGFGILPSHDNAATSDYLRGDYKGVPLQLLQCTLSSESGTGKNRRSTVVFIGLVIELDVPKRFSGHTTVRRDRGKIGNWFNKQFAGTLAPVHLEDPRFEERYEVFGTDQVEARYLLTTTFMERLIALEDLFAAHSGGRCNIQCAFKDGKLLFTIPTDAPWFATGSIFKPANFISDINLILRQMDLLFAIIEVLQLDDKTGL